MSVASESTGHSFLVTAESRLDLQSDGLHVSSADTAMFMIYRSPPLNTVLPGTTPLKKLIHTKKCVDSGGCGILELCIQQALFNLSTFCAFLTQCTLLRPTPFFATFLSRLAYGL